METYESPKRLGGTRSFHLQGKINLDCVTVYLASQSTRT